MLFTVDFKLSCPFIYSTHKLDIPFLPQPQPPPCTASSSRGLGPYAPEGSGKLWKWSRRSKPVLLTLIRTSEVRYPRSISEVNSNWVSSSLLRKSNWLLTHAYQVGALTFEITDNFGSNDVLPCGAYGPQSINSPNLHTATDPKPSHPPPDLLSLSPLHMLIPSAVQPSLSSACFPPSLILSTPSTPLVTHKPL